jgi:hypothetical protein
VGVHFELPLYPRRYTKARTNRSKS